MRYQKEIADAMQLPLTLEPKQEACFENFLWGKNLFLKTQLLSIGTPNQTEHLYYIWGEEGVGKSHLLKAACLNVMHPQTATYLPLTLLREYGSEVLDGLENQTLIAIDSLETIATDSTFEEKLFHLINLVQQNKKTTLLLSAQLAPNHIPIQLKDLKSRLHLGLSHQMLPLSDEEKIQILQAYAMRRGFHLELPVVDFLMHHYDRNLSHLLSLLKLLDTASLAEKRRVTIPFIKKIIKI